MGNKFKEPKTLEYKENYTTFNHTYCNVEYDSLDDKFYFNLDSSNTNYPYYKYSDRSGYVRIKLKKFISRLRNSKNSTDFNYALKKLKEI